MDYLLIFILLIPVILALWFLYEILTSSYNLLKKSPKVFYNKLFKLVGLITLIYLIFILQPVWDGAKIGFEQVWKNISSTWIIIIIKNIIKYIFILFMWFFCLGTLFGIIYIIGIIPISIINSVLKKLYGREELPIFKFPPQKDKLEIVSMIITTIIVLTPMIWIFIIFLWPMLSAINYQPLQ